MKSCVVSSQNQDLCLVFFLIILSLFLSTSFPLFTYSTSLALFGLAHVASELRYVDQRFARRLGPRYGLCLGIFLVGIILARSALVFKLAPAATAYYAELLIVLFMVLTVFIKIPMNDVKSIGIALVIMAIVILGIFLSPTLTLLLFAVFHNLTPMGFIIELVPPSHKKLSILLCGSIFFLVPLLIVCGFIVPSFAIASPDFSLLSMGPLVNNLSIFVPPVILNTKAAVNCFSAVVFAQCMHYVAVIYVMPKLLGHYQPEHRRAGFFSWPNNKIFWSVIACSSMILVTFYFSDFVKARALYGIAAAVHSYVELPILLFAFLAKNSATIATQSWQTKHWQVAK